MGTGHAPQFAPKKKEKRRDGDMLNVLGFCLLVFFISRISRARICWNFGGKFENYKCQRANSITNASNFLLSIKDHGHHV